jgi:hypothetical protein
MEVHEFRRGKGRTEVRLKAQDLGGDLIVSLFNENAHIGAVALGEFDQAHKRASVSVITRLGHKDDVVAQAAAHRLAKSLQKTVCAIAGIHVEDISLAEITRIKANATLAITELIRCFK